LNSSSSSSLECSSKAMERLAASFCHQMAARFDFLFNKRNHECQ
jgi:hypothetical protein